MPKAELFESVAERICGKPAPITSEDCLKRNSTKNCSCTDRCRIDEKSIEQLEYIQSSIDENIFLKACPGSGKTEVVALKTAFELNKWDKVGGIAVLSFTQNAANVITKRVSEFSGKVSHPHFIGTIDSWLHSYIAHPFAYKITEYEGKDGDKSLRLVDASSKAGFLSSFSSKYSYAKQKISANSYYVDEETQSLKFSSGDKALDQSRQKVFTNSEQWPIDDLCDTKEKFWKAGFVTYQDIEFIVFTLISTDDKIKNSLSLRFPFIIVDECQDLSWIQMEILKHLKGAGSKLHFVGDMQQAIYQFKEVDPTKVINFIDDNDFKKLELSLNFRSNQKVVDVCQEIVNISGIEAQGVQKLEKPCICLNYKKDEISQLANWFEQYLSAVDIDVNKSAIVARGWGMVRKLSSNGGNEKKNIQEKIASAIHLWTSGDTTCRKDALSYFGAFVAHHFYSNLNASKSKFYCPDGCSPIKWRVFLSKVLNDCNTPSLSDQTATWTKWAKNIKSQIHTILSKHKHILEDEEFMLDFEQCNFVALRGKSGAAVIDTIEDKFEGESSSVRTTTIHQVKGETLDAVMVVSAPTKQGPDGHWTKWLEDHSSEKARLAYVASSRPKHLLVWAVPEINTKEKNQLEGMGFKVKELSDLSNGEGNDD